MRIEGLEGEEGEETEPPKILPNRRALPQNPASPARAVWAPSPAGTDSIRPLIPLAPQTVGTTFTGATLSTTNAFPPDSMGTVGPSQFIVAVNNRIKSFNKATGVADGVLDTTTNNFFVSVRNGSGTSDPRIRYDRLSGLWFVLIINVSTPNRVLLAVSDGGTITGSTVWTYFFFQQDLVAPGGDTGCLADYPTLGVDANALYIGVNEFCPTSFSGTTGFVVRKSSVVGAGPIVVSAFRNLTGSPAGPGPYTPQGVDNFDASATEGYFIGVDNATFGTLMIRRVTTPGGVPSISSNISMTVPSTYFPLTVRHLGNTGGTNGYLDAIDDRLLGATIRNGRLWTGHSIGVVDTGVGSASANRDAVRWYELQNLTSTPSVVEAGTLFMPGNPGSVDERNYWMGTVMVSGQGHMALACSVAGTNERINAGTVGRLAGDTLGTLEAPILYTSSSTAYNPPGDTGAMRGRRRWGDYSYTSLDPCDDMTMWTIQEFCDATNSYGVQVAKLIAPPPVTPATATPPTVAQGLSSANVTITGASSAGSGFFEPGVGFSCHLAAAVTGGVIVNSVTYNSPTSVTLNISTVSASVGAKNVTISNPDGQSAIGTALLTITGSGPPPPTVTAINPISGPTTGATPVTITGTDFVATPTVTIGGLAATGVSFTSSTTLQAITPAHAAGPVNVVVTNPDAQSGTLLNGYTYGSGFFTVTPCRVLDTRSSNGPYGGPALTAGVDRTVVLTGQCGIPSGATAVAINATIVGPTAGGFVTLYPAGTVLPNVSLLNYQPGQTRANNAIILLGAGGDVTIHPGQPAGTTHFLIDVNGYLQ